MSEMTNKENVDNQYSDKEKLSICLNFHKKYGTNPVSYQDWLYGFYPLTDGCRILELGCGTGVFWEGKIESLPQNSEMILSDYSNGMLEVVKSKFSAFENVHFQQIDIQEIPFDKDSFDFVIANSMLYHVPDLEKALSEVKRVLKSGGTFICATLGEKGMHNWLHTNLIRFNPHIEAFNEGRHSFTLQNGTKFLQKYFKPVEVKSYDNALSITDTKDLIEYIRSTIGISGLTEEHMEGMYEFFEEMRKKEGSIHIPIDAGTFISRKE